MKWIIPPLVATLAMLIALGVLNTFPSDLLAWVYYVGVPVLTIFIGYVFAAFIYLPIIRSPKFYDKKKLVSYVLFMVMLALIYPLVVIVNSFEIESNTQTVIIISYAVILQSTVSSFIRHAESEPVGVDND